MDKRGGGIVTAVIGAIAAVAGVIMGFVGLSAIGAACGSVFSPTSYGAGSVSSAFVDNLCGDKVTGQTVWVWGLIVLGVGAIVVGVVLAVRGQPATQGDGATSSGEMRSPTA